MGEKTWGSGLKKIVLDTCSLIKFFKDEPDAGNVQKILSTVERGEVKCTISTITFAELFYILARYKSTEFAEAVLRHVKISRTRTADVSESIAELAGKFKFKYAGGVKGLPLADAIIAATASVGRAIVISHEGHFKKIKEVEVLTPKEFLKSK